MSTLIADLDSAPNVHDGDFVQSILNEMNGTGGGGGPPPPQVQTHAPIQPPPPAVGAFPSQGSVINAPNPNTIAPHTMDNGPITAHMIGNSHPTPADFATMMAGGGGGSIGVADSAAAYTNAPSHRQYMGPAPSKKSWIANTISEFRLAFFVVILVFVFSLPVVNFLFAHYLPTMVKSTGELTITGQLIKSFAAGAAFWVLHRVVVPLLSL